MNRTLLPALLLVVWCSTLRAATWQVGPTRAHVSPGRVSGLVKDGDTVAIDAGTYTADVTRWTANNLVLRGVGGYASLDADGTAYGGKAIWVITGRNTTVEWIEFSRCAVPDRNGAGIRQEGADLTVRHCRFHDNQDGILAGDNAESDILIEHCEFDNNGFGDGLSHNLYINHVASLTFRYNYSHRAAIGHELKSRAHVNIIMYNRLANEATGTASREIDLPNGGTAYIIGNEIHQGARGENSGIIGYGLEGLGNPTPHRLYVVNNTIVNDRGAGTFVHLQNGTELFQGYNNIFAGAGNPLNGTPASLDTAGNLRAGIAAVGFQDPAGYDYHLRASSPAVDAGAAPGLDGTFATAPDREYAHPADGTDRRAAGAIDIGAHERAEASSVEYAAAPGIDMSAAPNPFTESCVVSVPAAAGGVLVVYDELGREALRVPLGRYGAVVVDGAAIPAGCYLARLMARDGRVISRTRLVRR